VTVGAAEAELIIDRIRSVYANDFSQYSRPSFIRRLQRIVDADWKGNVEALIGELESNKEYFPHFLEELTVNVTELFREPAFFQSFRVRVLPGLRDLPEIRIWHAACSSGEEVYSMAILLKQEGLLERSTLTGTDINQKALETARSGRYRRDLFPTYAKNYREAHIEGELADHCSLTHEHFEFETPLLSRVAFKEHDLVSGKTLGQFDVVICRNALIYFQKTLQSTVVRSFKNSLTPNGFLCIGSSENLLFAEDRFSFDLLDLNSKIYRKRCM
jgi:chemotaxis protein methyltransferase CheR